MMRQGLEMSSFILEHIHGPFSGFPMGAHIGHRIQPMPGRRVDGAEVIDLKSGEKIFGSVEFRGPVQ